jgi:hypothetical protein
VGTTKNSQDKDSEPRWHLVIAVLEGHGDKVEEEIEESGDIEDDVVCLADGGVDALHETAESERGGEEKRLQNDDGGEDDSEGIGRRGRGRNGAGLGGNGDLGDG